ncbi:MAG: 3-deoxy-manno-octulosonate cytidylyltransferase [Thermodesulfobacteriota bacterium]
MNVIGIIPARMSSSRFPGKPLAKICGIPMIGHVYYRSKICKTLDHLYVATCDKEIADYIESIGGKAVMTANIHERASDRAAEAMLEIEAQIGGRIDIVVMIQGDEPMIYPGMIEESIMPMLHDTSLQVVNLMVNFKSREEQNDPNEVKVVVDLNNFALYFSREPIPSWKKGATSVPMLKQVCIIPFKRDFLIQFNALNPTPLEVIESVDMLRVLEHGYKVKMVLTKFETYSVDTIDDLRKVEALMASDMLMSKYK